MTASEPARGPVTDWATDFDHTDPEYAQNAHAIWDELRAGCPIARTERFGGAWLPTRHADVSAIAHDTEHFSSEGVIVSPWKPQGMAPRGYAPPITSDPPFHAEARRLLLPAFSPKEVERWEPRVREACRELLDDLVAGGSSEVDAAVQYAQHIPVRVIAEMCGVPREDGDKFRRFIHRVLETPGQGFEDLAPEETLGHYIQKVIADHRAEPRDDLVGFLLDAELDGEPLSDQHIAGSIALLLIAGIDTTWSSIGASLWHLAQHPDDRRRLIEEPGLMAFAIEELLRAYAPVTMARIVAKEVEIDGCLMHERDWVLLPFPAANRDPAAFEEPERVMLDRARNRHTAFGLGVHRCLGSNLARMELRVALEEWLARIPEFELADPDPSRVRWSTGQVRGPRELPIRILSTNEVSP